MHRGGWVRKRLHNISMVPKDVSKESDFEAVWMVNFLSIFNIENDKNINNFNFQPKD